MKKKYALVCLCLVIVLLMTGCSEERRREIEEKMKLHVVEDEEVTLDVTQKPEAPPIRRVSSLSGVWEHTTYPDSCHLVLKETFINTYTVTIEAIRGEAAQIAVATVEDVQIEDGKAEFSYEDSFGNKGTVWLSELDGKISLRIEHLPDQSGGWRILTAAGEYQRTDADPADWIISE